MRVKVLYTFDFILLAVGHLLFTSTIEITYVVLQT